MILYVVSAIPPIKVFIGSGQVTPGFLGFPVMHWTGTAYEQTDENKLKPRTLVPTQIEVYQLNGTKKVIEDPLRYYDRASLGTHDPIMQPQELLRTDILEDLLSAGMENNIITAYEVDDDYIGVTGGNTYRPEIDANGGFSMIESKLKASAITYTPYSSYAQGVINNKARYGQSVTVKVYNPASGASLTKHIYDALPESALPGTAQYSLPYRVAADIRPEGCPIFSFQYNDGGTDQLSHATEYIKGGTWRKVPLQVAGVSGSMWDKLALNNAREELNTRTAIALAGSAVGIGAGLSNVIGPSAPEKGLGESNVDFFLRQLNHSDNWGQAVQGSALSAGRLGVLGLAGTAASYAISSQKLRHQEDMLNARCQIAVAPIQIGQSEYIKDVGMNKFYYVFTSYAGDDMWNFDAFLTRFGYNVGNMPIRNRHFYSRKRFVYVRANEMQLISNVNSYYQVNKSILEKVETQLRQGVRIWRTKPDAHYTLPDGNNIIEEKAYV